MCETAFERTAPEDMKLNPSFGVMKKNISHWLPDVGLNLLAETIGETLRLRAERFGERPALHYMVDAATEELHSLSYRQLLRSAEACAKNLLSYTQPGDRIAVWSQNNVESVILQYACALSGTVLTPFNTAWTDAEITHALALTRPALAFVGKNHTGKDLDQRLRSLAACVVFALQEVDKSFSKENSAELPKVQQTDPFLIQFTSGTTGRAKGALLNHRAALLGGWLRLACDGAQAADVWLNPVPFHHLAGSCGVILGAMSVGGSFVVVERYDRDLVIRLAPKIAATRMGGVPTMWHDILSSPLLTGQHCRRLCVRSVGLGGSSVAPALVQELQQRLGAHCGIGYGQSESPIITATLPGDSLEAITQTVGRPLPHVELKIVDPVSGAIQPCGEPGEICVRSPVLMECYWNDPAATAATIDDAGFLHTGDLGVMDAQGYCSIKGRLRDVIIRGGENIYPVEIEDALHKHPAVALAAVIGVDHPRLGQEPCAVIKLRVDAVVSAADLEMHLAPHVASFKIPRAWHFVEQMPLTASGKIRKVELESLFRQH